VSCPRASDHHVRASILHWNRPTECLATIAALRTQGVPLQLTIIDNQSSAESLRTWSSDWPAVVDARSSAKPVITSRSLARDP
jgi:hypothetical protein